MLDRNLALELVRVTEAAALQASLWVGRGDNEAADLAAVKAMRQALNSLTLSAEVVIGEGERDQAPLLYVGERVGQKAQEEPQMDLAVDPLEGTGICARGGYGAISVLALGPRGTLLKAPDVYMQKIAASPACAGIVDLDLPVKENIHRVAQTLGKKVTEVTVVVLDRPRHKELIQELRQLGVRILLISDGDVSAGIACAMPDSGVDMLLGIGGAPEGVITAAALKCLNAPFQGRLVFQSQAEIDRAQALGLKDLERKYDRDELVQDEVFFAATGVTLGPLLEGVKFLNQGVAKTDSLVMRSRSGTIRRIQAWHNLNQLQKIRQEN